MDFAKHWTEYEYVAFDTETSGAYPVGFEVVEFGAVKWKAGKVIDRYQTLLKPSRLMSDFIIGIHGITNEMVADAPLMKDKVHEIRDFFSGSLLMAHHAPFDMGFMALEFEKAGIEFPQEPVLCTSLLARKLIHETVNHKLQTLVKFFGFDAGAAHRASDDARNCLDVGIKCFERLGPKATAADLIKAVGVRLQWSDYIMLGSDDKVVQHIIECIQQEQPIQFQYASVGKSNETRSATPIGIVRNPDGDYMMARCHRDNAQKRFYLSKIKLAGQQLSF